MLCTRRAQVEKRKNKLLTIDYSVVLSILLPIYLQPTHDDVDEHAPLRRYIQTKKKNAKARRDFFSSGCCCSTSNNQCQRDTHTNNVKMYNINKNKCLFTVSAVRVQPVSLLSATMRSAARCAVRTSTTTIFSFCTTPQNCKKKIEL